MPITIKSGFASLKQNLEITGLQKNTVSTRQSNVRNAVAGGLTVIDSFVSGSYARSTMIRPLSASDIDVFIVLDPKHFHEYQPTNLLNRLRTVLLRTYTKSPKISRDGQAVTITFADFKVDVVPGFNRKGGGYLIPDSNTNKWISTNPKVHSQTLTSANNTHDGNLVPIVKMIKGWNRNINEPFVGFYLELLTTKVLTDVTISDYPSGVRFVFDKGREAVKYTIVDPAGYGSQIGGLRGITKDNAVSRFETAYNRALKAESYARQGKNHMAYAEWQKIFGDYFPTYG